MSGICSCASNSSISASGICSPASFGTTCQRRKVSYSPLSRSTDTRMSTSPPCSFLVADASAASTASKTTSSSTLFSREMASTSISISRFIVSDLRLHRAAARAAGCAPGILRARPLKSSTGTSRASRTSSSWKSSACSAFVAASAARRQPSPAATSAPRVVLAALERHLQGHVDLVPGKALVVGGRASAAGPGPATTLRAARKQRPRPRARTATGG